MGIYEVLVGILVGIFLNTHQQLSRFFNWLPQVWWVWWVFYKYILSIKKEQARGCESKKYTLGSAAISKIPTKPTNTTKLLG